MVEWDLAYYDSETFIVWRNVIKHDKILQQNLLLVFCMAKLYKVNYTKKDFQIKEQHDKIMKSNM